MSASDTVVKLSELIELCDERNTSGLYGADNVMGMTITKEVIPTKAKVSDTDLSKFLVVKPNEFVYNPRTHGKRIGLGYNNTGKPFIISWNNTAFRVKDERQLYHAYLYMYLNRLEWDRNACFRSWGSSTEVFSWSEFCLMEIPLPSIEVQRELVGVYEGLKALAEENEAMVEPLSKACEAFVVDCMKKYEKVKLGEYIEEFDERNSNGTYDESAVRGISTSKELIYTKANLDGVSLKSYKILRPQKFVYVADTSRRGDKMAFAINHTNESYLVSSIYTIFRIKDEDTLLPEFLFILLSRGEFDRYARFNSWGSARETFDWNEMCRVAIPLPPLDIQQKIVDLYNCAEECKRIAAEAREQLKMICPALVQKAAHAS